MCGQSAFGATIKCRQDNDSAVIYDYACQFGMAIFHRTVDVQSDAKIRDLFFVVIFLRKVPYFSISEKKWETFKITTFSRRSLLQSDCIGTFLENFILN